VHAVPLVEIELASKKSSPAKNASQASASKATPKSKPQTAIKASASKV